MKKLSSFQADLVLVLVAFLWGTGFAITKIGLGFFSPVKLLFFRFLIASLVSVILFYKNLKKINKNDLKSGIIMGIFLSIAYIFQTVGLKDTTAGNSAFLTGTNVVMVPFLYWIVSKKMPAKNNMAAAFLMFLGIILLTVDFKNFGNFNFADMLTFICAIFFACHIVVTGIFASDKDPFVISTVQMIISSIIFFFMMFFDDSAMVINMKSIGSMLYLGIVTTMICFLFQTIGQKFTTPSHAAIILSLESVIGSIFGMIILKEEYTFIMIIAFFVIFASILMAELDFELLLKRKGKDIKE